MDNYEKTINKNGIVLTFQEKRFVSTNNDMGHGYPITGNVLKARYKPSIGVDVVTSVSGDLFSQMRFMLQAERARKNQLTLVT